MMMRTAILNDDHTVDEVTMEEWYTHCNTRVNEKRDPIETVRRDTYNGVTISTVFLGMGDGNWFETAVVDDYDNMFRTSTYAGAVEQHLQTLGRCILGIAYDDDTYSTEQLLFIAEHKRPLAQMETHDCFTFEMLT